MISGHKTFTIEVLTPQLRVYTGRVVSAVFPAEDGLFGVLGGMAPEVATIGAGPLRLRDTERKTLEFFVAGGFVHVLGDVMTVLAEEALAVEQIDFDEAWDELERAKHMPVDSPLACTARQQALLAAGVKINLLQKHRKTKMKESHVESRDIAV